MNACAVGMLAPAMPARLRARKSIGSEVASAKNAYDRAEPSSPIRMTGLRPIRSDNRPQNGANRNCASENEDDSRPTITADAPKCSA